MSDDVAISVEHVSKDFVLSHEKVTRVKDVFLSAFKRRTVTKQKLHALNDVSFEIKKGEFFGIVGRNGSGKSTMLKILASIYLPTKGKIQVRGRLVPFIELGVGFNPELTGRENVYLNGAMMGFSEQETNAMYNDIVAFAELEEFMDQKLKNYSSGMQVRLAFSVAIKAEADVLLVDEVLAVGDAAFKRKCFDYFKKLKKDKKTVVFVSHDMDAVREFCDRALIIEASKLMAIGKTSRIASQYSRLFIDEAEDGQFSLESSAQERWGDGAVKAEGVSLAQKVLTDNTPTLKFTTTIKAARDTENIVTGFTVKDGFGTEICGTNTQIKGVKLASLHTDESCEVEWECANIFADGQHTIDVSVHGVDGATVHDWWEGAAVFKVKRSEKTAYRISPTIKVAIKAQQIGRA